MKSSNSVVLKSGMWYTISNFLGKGIGFITVPIFTRLLSQEEFGIYNNYNSWIGILSILFSLNLESTLISARYEYSEKLDEYISSILSLSMLSISFWWIITNIFMNTATELFQLEETYINAMFTYIFFSPTIQIFQMRERYAYRYKISAILSMILSVGASLISVILVVFMENKVDGRILGSLLPTFCIGIILAVYLYSKGKKICVSYWPQALKIALPYIPHVLSLSVLNQVDRVMITKLCGERETALYSLAYNVASIIALLIFSLNGAVAPWIGEKLSKKEYLNLRDYSKKYILFFVCMVVGIMLWSPEILLFFGGESYVDAKWIMIPISIGFVCQFLYSLFVNVEQFEKKTVGMAFASVSAALINFILNAWLIPKFGYVAAAYTTLIGYLWLLLVHMWLVYRLKLSHVYSYRFICLILIVVSIIGGVIAVLYSVDYIRYIISFIYLMTVLFVLYKKKSSVLSLIKR